MPMSTFYSLIRFSPSFLSLSFMTSSKGTKLVLSWEFWWRGRDMGCQFPQLTYDCFWSFWTAIILSVWASSPLLTFSSLCRSCPARSHAFLSSPSSPLHSVAFLGNLCTFWRWFPLPRRGKGHATSALIVAYPLRNWVSFRGLRAEGCSFMRVQWRCFWSGCRRVSYRVPTGTCSWGRRRAWRGSCCCRWRRRRCSKGTVPLPLRWTSIVFWASWGFRPRACGCVPWWVWTWGTWCRGYRSSWGFQPSSLRCKKTYWSAKTSSPDI